MLLTHSLCLNNPKRRWFVVTAATSTLIFPSKADAVVAAFHDLLPCPADWKVPTHNFGDKIKEIGISKIFFLRHGQKGKSDTGDFDRILTDVGREQARVAGSSYGKDTLMPIFPKVLVSPAPRTVETARLFLQAAADVDDDTAECNEEESSSSSFDLVPVQELYDKTMQPDGSKLLAKIGYAPLRDYLDASDEYDRGVARDPLGKYATVAVDVIYNEVLDKKTENGSSSQTTSIGPCTLLVVAHAIYLPAATMGVASVVGCNSSSDLQIPLSMNTQEAEGYLIDLSSRTLAYISRPTT